MAATVLAMLVLRGPPGRSLIGFKYIVIGLPLSVLTDYFAKAFNILTVLKPLGAPWSLPMKISVSQPGHYLLS